MIAAQKREIVEIGVDSNENSTASCSNSNEEATTSNHVDMKEKMNKTASGQNIERKRNFVESDSSSDDLPPPKKACDSRDSFAKCLQTLNHLNDKNVGKITKLQMELDKINRENVALQLSNTQLDDEKNRLERMVADLKLKNSNEKQTFDDEKKKLMEKISALSAELVTEKRKSDVTTKGSEENYVELERAWKNEKKLLEEERNMLMAKNSALEMQLCAERKKFDDEKKRLVGKIEEILELNNSKIMECLQL